MIIFLGEDAIASIVASLSSALVTILGVAITAIVSIHNLKKESYSNRVTNERINWLNKVRQDYSIIMGAYELKHAGNNNFDLPNIDKKQYDEQMIEAEKAKYDLISRLRESPYPGNEYNSLLKDTLFEIKFVARQEEKDVKMAEFATYMNFMLEEVWDKCKEETK